MGRRCCHVLDVIVDVALLDVIVDIALNVLGVDARYNGFDVLGVDSEEQYKIWC